MSGHSKWAQIKRQKGVADVKKGKTFTKISNAITIAVKQGGGIGDPDQNFRLRLVIDSAKMANMPKENIERAIKRATSKEAGEFEEVIYEGFAPGGKAVLVIEAATDNSQRTTSVIKSIFNKAGANFGQPGSVMYQFRQVGQIIAAKSGKTFDEIFEISVDAGVEDVEEAGDEVFIYTDVSNMKKIKELLSEKGIEVVEAEITRIPVATVKLEEGEQAKVESFIESIEELDDVQKVYSNLE
jgi:YebC/PmpR family DNA-binding regulatory protein